MDLAQLRIQFADAKAVLREQKADHETMKAIREQFAIDSGAHNGCKNAEDRARALLIALDQDDDYLGARNRLRDAEYEVERLTAEITSAEDARDTEKLRVRDEANRVLDRLAAAYERLARQNPVVAAIDAALPL